MDQIRKFAVEFFENLKCDVSWEGDVLVVENVPRSFEDLSGKSSPYRLNFVSEEGEGDFVGKGSVMFSFMIKYLKGAGKASILKIDFDVDAEREIRKKVGFKNCELESLSKKYHNGFFSRFSFSTSFNYLNESEKLLSEIYVYDGKIVEGDLNGYSVSDGRGTDIGGRDVVVDKKRVKMDYEVARVKAVELTGGKREEISGILKKRVEAEVDRIREHYDNILKEIGGDLNGKIDKIREVELALRSCSGDECDSLRKKLIRLKGSLVKAGDDESISRVLKEREMTVRDAMHKFSLNVDRKLVNTTVIYYPIYSFRLCLKGDGVSKFVDVGYNPLTRELSGFDCESCGCGLDRIALCGNGHLSCDDCLSKCGECGGVFCKKCLKRSCSVCGRVLCRDCARVCFRCGKVVCSTHLRKDCVSGEERCVSCLRACLRCQGLSEEKFFGEALDGSKVCQKCLGRERSGKVLDRVFRR